MDKSLFSTIFKLQKKQPWLSEHEDKVLNLLYEDCKSTDQRELLISLLDRFTYLKNTDFNNSLNTLCDEIVTDPELNSNDTQLVSLTADNFADSGQSILYSLKPRLENRGWRDHLLINRFGSSFKEFNRNGKKHINIIFVDEYVGSGQTILSRYNEIQRQYTGTEIKIKFFVIAASTVGLINIKKENIEVICIYEIKRGISDFYLDKEVIKKYMQLMDELEDNLSQNYNGKELPKYGYGKVESLYAREDGNTPNSVFPIFWWPFYKNQNVRVTLLTRAMRDA